MEKPEILKKLEEANKFLQVNLKTTKKDITHLLNTKNSKYKNKDRFLTPSEYSNYTTASAFYKRVNEITAWTIYRALEKEVIELGGVWNGKEFIIPPKDTIYDKRLEGVFGVWEAFTWDADTSTSTKIPHVHAFKIEIKTINEITCETRGATFSSGSISLLTTEKIIMEIAHPQRKVYCIVRIGSDQLLDLKKRDRFLMAYIDSGSHRIKTGRAILDRSTEKFADIVPKSLPLSHFEGKKNDFFFEFLFEQQIVITN